MAEKVILRFHGGPLAGQALTPEIGWPPPDTIQAELGDGTRGIYRQTNRSQLSDEQFAVVRDVLVRGAEYRWEPEED